MCFPAQSDCEEFWDKEDCEELELYTSFSEVPPGLPEDSASQSTNPWLIGFLLILQAKYYMPDTAMNALLKFLHVLFIVLGHFSPKIASLVDLIPSSVYSLGKILGHSLQYTKYVVCPKCHRLCTFEECYPYIRSSMQ